LRKKASFFLPPGEWTDRSLRIPILREGKGALALGQPLPPRELPEPPTRLLARLYRERVATPDPGALWSPVYDLPTSGPIVLARDRESRGRLRDSYGSGHWTLSFLLLVREAPDPLGDDRLTCELPVARHRREPRSLVSHRTGKKARTDFRKVVHAGTLALWEARTDFLRPDQVRLHAAELGLAICGENVYGSVPPLSRADLPATRRPGGREHVLLNQPAYHLQSVQVPELGAEPVVSPAAKPLRKWIEAHADPGIDLPAAREAAVLPVFPESRT
jgi:hypothetical protein